MGGLLSSLMRADNLPPSTAGFLGTRSATTFFSLAESAGFLLKPTPVSKESGKGNDEVLSGEKRSDECREKTIMVNASLRNKRRITVATKGLQH